MRTHLQRELTGLLMGLLLVKSHHSQTPLRLELAVNRHLADYRGQSQVLMQVFRTKGEKIKKKSRKRVMAGGEGEPSREQGPRQSGQVRSLERWSWMQVAQKEWEHPRVITGSSMMSWHTGQHRVGDGVTGNSRSPSIFSPPFLLDFQ